MDAQDKQDNYLWNRNSIAQDYHTFIWMAGAMDALVEVTRTGSFTELRQFGIAGLAKTKRPGAIQVILGALDDKDANVRMTAVFQLGLILETRPKRLELLAHQDPDSNVRMTADVALRKIDKRIREQGKTRGK